MLQRRQLSMRLLLQAILLLILRLMTLIARILQLMQQAQRIQRTRHRIKLKSIRIPRIRPQQTVLTPLLILISLLQSIQIQRILQQTLQPLQIRQLQTRHHLLLTIQHSSPSQSPYNIRRPNSMRILPHQSRSKCTHRQLTHFQGGIQAHSCSFLFCPRKRYLDS